MAAAVMPKVPESDGLSSILKLFEVLGPSFGSGKQTSTGTETTTGTINPGVKGQSDALIAQILGQNDNPALNDLVTNILERAKQQFAPAIGQSISGGNRALSDTVLKQLANEATARATGEAAGAKLNFIQGNNSTAAGLVNSQVQASRGTTATRTGTQQTGASPLGQAAQLGGLALSGYSLYKKFAGKKAAPFSTNGGPIDAATGLSSSELSNIFSGGGSVADPIAELTTGLAGPGTSAGFAELPDFSFSGSFAPTLFDYSDGASSLIEGASSGLGGAGELAFASGADSLVEGATSLADIGDFASGFGDFADVAGGGFPVIGPALNLLQGDIGGAAGSAIGGAIGSAILPGPGTVIGSFLGDTIGGGSVVCTELLRQGKMTKELYALDIRFAHENLSRITLRGYRYWAIPLVRKMRRSERLSRICAFFANHRAKSLSGKSMFGSIFRRVFEPICFLIGFFVREDKDYKVLYQMENC